MGMFTKVSSTAFKSIQTDAGMLLNYFNPENPTAPTDSQIICLTTGGISAKCEAQYTDFAEDIDNLPNNTKEYKRLTGWNCEISTTSYDTTAENIKLSLGAADVSSSNSKIVPRMELRDSDFADVWWVGDRLDGGWVAVRLINALSTAGFSIQTSKNGKGTIPLTLGGHVSTASQDVVPMEFYIFEGDGTYLSLTPDVISFAVDATSHQNITIAHKPSADSTVSFTSSDTNVVTVNSSGVLTAVAAGIAYITGSATVDTTTYTDEVIVRITAAASS